MLLLTRLTNSTMRAKNATTVNQFQIILFSLSTAAAVTGERQWEHSSNDKENILKLIISTVFIISVIDIKTSLFMSTCRLWDLRK